ncbi:hypothetical protein SAMN05661010_02491 [Modicisalibacter muralis]|uniref:DUF4190 domain-containing protein n=1 Tax=Modicisalibacter muralis TaxID=119000 RepID=A0A1G9MRQ3_9GAMM|nr:DUF4190 domain-containing protein [Halomonas muralis]SDL76920.1 hypothetical protein SAMN05661010_02491 [Halomonas muralis]
MRKRDSTGTQPPSGGDRSENDQVSRRYANWAIAAVVTAMLSLFFDMLAPLLGLMATIFALLGLRRIRSDPERYQGRGFCWAAIALAVIVAGLSLLVESAPGPETESRVSQLHYNVVPGSVNVRATA